MRRVVVALALVLAACGSTAQTGRDGGAVAGTPNAGLAPVTTVGDGSGIGSPSAGASGVVSGGTVAPGSSTGGGTGSSGSPAGAGSGSGSGPAAAGPGGRGRLGPGVSDETIALGIPFCNDCAAANAALGAGGEDPGDTRRYVQAALDEVNARGGVLGRDLVPVYHEVSAADDITLQQQEACETFTADNEVLMIFFRGEIIYECANEAGILAIGGDGVGPVFEKYPNLFAPASIRLERLFQVTVRSMVRAGWHEPDPRWPIGKIGLITWDTPDYRYAMEHGYLAGLEEAGLEAEEVRYIAVPAAAGSIAEASAAISNAVLSFRSAGIDHVFIGDGQAGIFAGAGLSFLFLTNAESQGYRPRYGFNSNNSPDFDSHPPEQLVGMLAIDSYDTSPENDEGIELNPVRERCFQVMRDAGLPVGQAQTQAVAIGACAAAWWVEAVVNAASDTTLANMIAGAESLGTSYRSPYSYGNRLAPGQHDGVALFRALAWDEECACIVYTSAPFEP
jgi:hypothetical protein